MIFRIDKTAVLPYTILWYLITKKDLLLILGGPQMDEEVKVETPVTEVKTKDPSELKLNYPRTLKVG